MKHLLSIILLLCSVLIFGQAKIITGSVMIDNVDDLPRSGIRIDNLRSYAKTFTNAEGNYSIPVIVGDTLEFTAGYVVPRRIVISENLYQKAVLQVHLDVETVELSEAVIGKLDKDFQKNLRYRRDLKGDIYNSIGLDQRLRDLEPKKDISKFKATDILSPVRLIGHVNGYYKKQRRIQQFERNQNILNEIINFFPDEYFIDTLKLPEYKVQEFLMYADKKIDLKSRVMNRQFELIGLELEPIADMYLKELNKRNSNS
ncbi:hypothetical protein [Faecalibacter sp. LW9]|uniref:hypothetical protein n=1 Tax=Faecalibacter sp. LW9 TaxID=3103144 RepID=UPI002AFF6CC8|nr:hypothetical protein [Faecalibacter sp. LW9]